MSGVSRIATGVGPVSTLPLTSPVSVPLKKGDGEDFDRPLRPTLSFRQKPEPPKLPQQLAAGDDNAQQPLRPTLSFRRKPEPPMLRNGEQLERTLRTTLSFRGKPEPPKSVNFADPPKATEEADRERQKQMQKTKSKIDMLSNLIREGSSAGASPSHDSSSDEESDDEAVPMNQGTGGRILIRPSAPPPAPPGLAQASSLPPLPPVSIKPPAPPAPPAAAAASSVPDDNARENWVTMWSPEQKCNYWFNKKTGVSTWEDPTVLPQAPPSTSPPGTMRGSGGPSRANDLEKQIHKKTMDSRGSNDDEVDVFGRSGAQRGSGGSNGSSNSSRQSLRATLSRALFGSSKKLPVPKKDESPRTSDSMPHEHRGPILNAPPPDASQTGGVSPEDLRSTVRSQGSMVSFTSSTSHESEGSAKSHTHQAKHVEVVAEVVTKAGRHTIVRAKKSKKKDHSMPLSTAPATPPPMAAQPGMMQPMPMQPSAVQPVPMQPAGVHPSPMQPDSVQPMPVPMGVQPIPMQSGIAPPVAMQPPAMQHGMAQPPAMQHGMMQPMPMVQQQGLVRTASARNMPPASPYGGMQMPQPMQHFGMPQPMQHFGMPHPQQMGGPAFLQPQPFAAYAQQTAAPPYAPYAPPSPQPMAAARVQHVQALYDFMPSDPNNSSELALRRGDVLQLIEQGDDGWWEGIHSATGQRGLFPGSHVHLIS